MRGHFGAREFAELIDVERPLVGATLPDKEVRRVRFAPTKELRMRIKTVDQASALCGALPNAVLQSFSVRMSHR